MLANNNNGNVNNDDDDVVYIYLIYVFSEVKVICERRSTSFAQNTKRIYHPRRRVNRKS